MITKKNSVKINPDYLMCMLCENCCHYSTGEIECQYEEEGQEFNPNILKNFDCGAFEFHVPYLVEVLVRLIKEIRGK